MEMTYIRVLAIGLMLALGVQSGQAQTGGAKLEGTITISGAWALYPMVVKWAEEFQKIHPAVKIDITAGGAGKGVVDAIAAAVDIGMVSRDIYPEEVKKGAWWIPVTKDAVVPTINENNPCRQELLSKGMKKQSFSDIWITGKEKKWDAKTEIHVYTRSDACGAAETWAKYLDKKQEDLLGVGVYGDPGLAEAVRRDISGIGYNNINYVYDAKTKEQIEGIRVLPIDFNGNGRLDKDEDFYSTRDSMVEAIATERYPSPPARDLHFVCQGKPQKTVVAEFIRWILTDGQQYVSEAGYINLSDEKLQAGLKKLEAE